MWEGKAKYGRTHVYLVLKFWDLGITLAVVTVHLLKKKKNHLHITHIRIILKFYICIWYWTFVYYSPARINTA